MRLARGEVRGRVVASRRTQTFALHCYELPLRRTRVRRSHTCLTLRCALCVVCCVLCVVRCALCVSLRVKDAPRADKSDKETPRWV